ncbi:YIP1 family protein [Lysinibacillus halotolerans]|uniref:YIP1 family protein n=1 Tax=Lysinibacillus halotolerans TaxID=1368476 RepID=A0A3M8H828_9BACI|nr:YIP1 family protein [Lysinibacillus halotolerans]RNC98458.1 YIP1 family protein [Lysinibacillus halotolerans]
MNEQEQQNLNPFLSVWLHPKKTARYVMDHKGIPYSLFIIIIGYIGVFCASIIDTELYPFFPIWGILILLIFCSVFFGIISNAFYSLIVWPIGKMFKGVGTYQEIFKGLSLISIPYVILIPFYIIWMFTDPYSLFTPDVEGSSLLLVIITLLLTVVVTVWCIVISVAVIAEAHQISNWKAFFTLLIPTVIFTILFIIVFIFLAIIGIAIGSFFAY